MNNRLVIIILALVLLILISSRYLIMINDPEYILQSGMENDNLSPMEKTLEQMRAIQAACGELCDTDKEITPGEFIGHVTSKVDCDTLFRSPVFHQPALLPPTPWQNISDEIKELYTYNGRVEMREWFWGGDAGAGVGRTAAHVFTQSDMQQYIDAFLAGNPVDTYKNGSNLIALAADFVDVAGKTILVIGSQSPWVEAVLLTKNVKKIITLEYGYFVSEHPNHDFILPEDFRQMYLEGTLPIFDAIFTYSSIEHSGVGRYGDTMNPWGDIMGIAEAWCVSSKDAQLALGVATRIKMENGAKGKDINEWNAHKVYGPVTYPFLATNWKFVYPTQDVERLTPHSEPIGVYQPVFVFKKL